MNNIQKIVLIITLLLIVLIALFPPYIGKFEKGKLKKEGFIGLFPIYDPPNYIDIYVTLEIIDASENPTFYSAKIDISRFAIQLVFVLVIASILVLILKNKKGQKIRF